MVTFNIVFFLFCFIKKGASLPLLYFAHLHESSMVPMVVWLNKSSVKPEVAIMLDISMCDKKISCIKLHLFKSLG